MSSTISSKGQITLPKAVREALGLKSGDAVDFLVRDGQAILRRVKAWTVDDLMGCLKEYAHQGPDISQGHDQALAEALQEHFGPKDKRRRS